MKDWFKEGFTAIMRGETIKYGSQGNLGGLMVCKEDLVVFNVNVVRELQHKNIERWKEVIVLKTNNNLKNRDESLQDRP